MFLCADAPKSFDVEDLAAAHGNENLQGQKKNIRAL